MHPLVKIASLFKAVFAGYARHRTQWLAAAIAYFTLFAIAPLIIVVVEIGGLILGQHRALLNSIYGYLTATAGSGAADAVRGIVRATFHREHSTTTTQIIGWGIFCIATIGLFASLQQALNIVWDVEPKRQSIMRLLGSRLISFGIVVLMAFLLLLSVLANTALNAGEKAMAHLSPAFPVLAKAGSFLITVIVMAVALSVVFGFLPDRRISWKDVWLGGIITASLFAVGQYLLGLYLGHTGLSSTFGAFGSLIVFVFWTYYSAQILLFGAEFTHVYAHKFGSRRPSEKQ